MLPTSPWWERIPAFGNLGLPIALKEVRSLIRRNRYFWAQFIYLAILAVGVVIIIAVSQGKSVDREQIGVRLFWGFFAIQYVLVCLVFPAFAATSFSAEKAEKSFDLLVTTDLSPTELVWGKFLGIFGNCCYFLLVTLPLLGTCILFGGVSLGDAFENYLCLVALAALITIYGIWVSSTTGNNIRAVMATYGPVFLFSLPALSSFQLLARGGADGLVSLASGSVSGPELSLLVAISLYGVVGFFCFCFIAAVMRLTSPEAVKYSTLRIFVLLALVGGLVLVGWSFMLMSAEPGYTVGVGLRSYGRVATLLTVLLAVACLAFASGSTRTPLKTARFAHEHGVLTRVFWLFLPGGTRGVCFAVVLLALAVFGVRYLGGTILGFDLPAEGSDPTMLAASVAETHLKLGLFVFGILAYSAFAFLLSTLGVRGFLNWAIVLACAVLLTLLAVVAMVGDGTAQGEWSPFYATSILVTHISYGEASGGRETLVYYSLGFHGLLALACFTGGLVALRLRREPGWRVKRPGWETFTRPPVPAA